MDDVVLVAAGGRAVDVLAAALSCEAVGEDQAGAGELPPPPAPAPEPAAPARPGGRLWAGRSVVQNGWPWQVRTLDVLQ